ncbi:hypothetical protein PN466_10840 [Roseofilum reptotaenium CS-1145]|uniref:Uncharacterized protein n=2 Tax=Roseofilum TaxID=1233426 RepID=A0A1L9QLX8_9CYAN|nr:hypothetical protein [Roseofilum reptotaenium CS-1145]OJJ20706.1 hypothetical protein BI308_20640 [Roseofilum reptotaenium AO1-A]
MYLLDHPYSGDKSLEEISVTSGQYPRQYPNPVRFEINYKKDDTWNLDWYDISVSDTKFSGKKLEGEGRCQNAKIATGKFEYPDKHHSFNVIFKHIKP